MTLLGIGVSHRTIRTYPKNRGLEHARFFGYEFHRLTRNGRMGLARSYELGGKNGGSRKDE